MPVTDSKEMLMESLTHIWCKNEIILILLISIMNTKALASRVGKPGYNIAFHTLCAFVVFVSFYPKWRGRCILNSIMVIDSLIAEASWLRYLTTRNQSLNRTHQGIRALLTQLILY